LVKVAIPRFQERVAPCFEYSATIAIFTIEEGAVVDQRDFALQSRRDLDRVRLLNDQEVGTLICGGLQESFEDLVKARGIHVISWVVGEVEDVLGRFLRGELASGQNSRRQHEHDVSHANTEDGPRCRINSSKKPTS
jgi:predicted Fe-Mo cluster-binding NifX family protein